MKFKKKISAKEFAGIVGECESNIHTLRSRSRKAGLLNNNESLTEDYLAIWDVAKKLHYDKNIKWDDAIDYALTPLLTKPEEDNLAVAELKEKSQVSNTIEEKLDEVIIYLKKIAIFFEEPAKTRGKTSV